MRFNVGDTIKLIKQKNYNGIVIPPGTTGIIEEAYPMSRSYLVKFDGIEKSRRVMEGDIE